MGEVLAGADLAGLATHRGRWTVWRDFPAGQAKGDLTELLKCELFLASSNPHLNTREKGATTTGSLPVAYLHSRT